MLQRGACIVHVQGLNSRIFNIIYLSWNETQSSAAQDFLHWLHRGGWNHREQLALVELACASDQEESNTSKDPQANSTVQSPLQSSFFIESIEYFSVRLIQHRCSSCSGVFPAVSDEVSTAQDPKLKCLIQDTFCGLHVCQNNMFLLFVTLFWFLFQV